MQKEEEESTAAYALAEKRNATQQEAAHFFCQKDKPFALETNKKETFSALTEKFFLNFERKGAIYAACVFDVPWVRRGVRKYERLGAVDVLAKDRGFRTRNRWVV